MKTTFSSLVFLVVCALVGAVTAQAQSTYEPYLFSTFAGLAGSGGSVDGTGSAARFNAPIGVAVDSVGNVYVADTANHTIRKITPAGVVSTFAGSPGVIGSADGTGSAAQFSSPEGVAVDSAGNVYVAEYQNHTIRKITPARVVSTLAGSAGSPGSADGTGSAARFNNPADVALDSAGNVYVADTYNYTIRKITPAGVVSTLAGLAGSVGSADGTGSAARFDASFGVAVNSAGNVYVADTLNYTVRKITPAGVVSTLAGLAGSTGSADGTGSAARFYFPVDATVDSAGNVYVADHYNHTIRKITPARVVSTLAGSVGSPGSDDGTGSAARFNTPVGVAVDSAGSIYVADTGNNVIRVGIPAFALVWDPAAGGNGHYYELINQELTWFNAKTSAEARGGYLATITSAAENSFVYNLAKDNIRTWLGGYQPSGSQNWTWVTGEQFSYQNWAPGEPNNLDGIEDYVQLFGSTASYPAGWNDGWYYSPTPAYVIEYGAPPPFSPPLPSSAPSVQDLPSPNNFYTDLPNTLNFHGNEFSPESFSFLTSAANSTAPLIDSSSPKYLKNFAANWSQSLGQVSDIMGVAAIVTSGAPISEMALDLSIDVWMDFAISNLPPDQRNEIDEIWDAVDTISDFLLESTNPLSFSLAVNSLFLGEVLAPAVDLFAQDPPDPNYQTIYEPHITYPSLMPPTGNAELDVLIKKQTYAVQAAAAYLQAVNASFDKYAGAIQANDNIYAALQMEAVLNYLKLYNQAAQEAVAAIQASQKLLKSLGLSGGMYDPAQLAALQNEIATNGLPAETETQLEKIGLSAVQIDEVKQALLALDPNAYSGTLEDANNLASSTLLQASTPVAVAVSRKIHNGTPRDVNLPLTGPAGIECRSGGAGNDYQIVVTFPNVITFTDAGIKSGTGNVSSTTGGGTTVVTVNLAGVTNAQTITLTLSGVNDGNGIHDLEIPMSVLVGDTTGNGAVNSSDVAQTKSKSGQAVGASNFRSDVTANGSINSSDVSLVKSKSGTGLP